MAEEITLKIVLDHIVAMEQRLTKSIDSVKQAVLRTESRLLSQIDAIDERLDLIEIETLPKRVRKLEATIAG